jgi:hypothetical protein
LEKILKSQKSLYLEALYAMFEHRRNASEHASIFSFLTDNRILKYKKWVQNAEKAREIKVLGEREN